MSATQPIFHERALWSLEDISSRYLIDLEHLKFGVILMPGFPPAIRITPKAQPVWQAGRIWEWMEKHLVQAREISYQLPYQERRRQTIERQRPAWADRKAIRAVYAECERRSKSTGVPHHVDHVLPLRGRLVSGLHVAQNLQVLTKTENSKKYNHFEVEA